MKLKSHWFLLFSICIFYHCQFLLLWIEKRHSYTHTIHREGNYDWNEKQMRWMENLKSYKTYERRRNIVRIVTKMHVWHHVDSSFSWKAPCKMKGKLKNATRRISRWCEMMKNNFFHSNSKLYFFAITEKTELRKGKILESHHFIFQNHNWIKSWYGNTPTILFRRLFYLRYEPWIDF